MLEGKLFSQNTTLPSLTRPTLESWHLEQTVLYPLMKGRGFLYEYHPYKPNAYVFGHPGFGCQTLHLDPENQLSVVYLTNGLKSATKSCYLQRNLIGLAIESEEDVQQGSHTLQMHNPHLKEGDLEHKQQHIANIIANTTTPRNRSVAQDDDLMVHKLLNTADNTNKNHTLLHIGTNSTSSSEESTELQGDENKVEDANVEEGLEHGYASNYAEAAE
uniref:Beta-lactamase-related domain-containing protein n=1 Tax=Ditylenchus dipsaci TaxID=166011 RepID=A0A915E006_9BILA